MLKATTSGVMKYHFRATEHPSYETNHLGELQPCLERSPAAFPLNPDLSLNCFKESLKKTALFL